MITSEDASPNNAESRPGGYVIDASVGIKLFIFESLTEQAHGLFARAAADPATRLIVPDLFYVECANVLRKHVRLFGYPVRKAREDIKSLRSFNLLSVPTAELVEESFSIALEHDITDYDACYVALAERKKVSLVTADKGLVRKLKKTHFGVQALDDFF